MRAQMENEPYRGEKKRERGKNGTLFTVDGVEEKRDSVLWSENPAQKPIYVKLHIV